MSYNIKTTTRNFDATADLYHFTALFDTVLLHYSPITRSIQKITATRENERCTFETGYIRNYSGSFFVPALLLVLVLYHIFYYNILYLRGRRDLLYALIIGTVIVFMFHIGIVIF